MLLYKSIAGPHLESYRQFWSLHLIKDTVEWREAQEKATKLIKSLDLLGGISWKALILCGGVYKNLRGRERVGIRQPPQVYMYSGELGTCS